MPRQPDYLSLQLAGAPPFRALLRSVECKLMGAVPLRPPILDVGCGDGHFASVSYPIDLDVGIDVAWRDVNEAGSRQGAYKGVLVASATELPFPDCYFNTVVSNCVIEHIPNLDGVLNEIARVLKPGGTFATTLPSERYGEMLLVSTVARRLGLAPLARAYGDFFNHISGHHNILPPAEWTARLAAVGLRVIEQNYYFSASAHRAFDLGHYLSLPNLVTRLIFGRWVLHPAQTWPFRRWFRRYYEEPLPEIGAYWFVRCERVS